MMKLMCSSFQCVTPTTTGLIETRLRTAKMLSRSEEHAKSSLSETFFLFKLERIQMDNQPANDTTSFSYELISRMSQPPFNCTDCSIQTNASL